MAQDLSLRDYYKIFKKNKWLIGIFTFTVSVLAIVISLLLPVWYSGTAQVIRPQSQILDMTSFQIQANSIFGSADGPTTRDLSILNSRLLKEKICKEYNLIETYKVKWMDKAVKKFEENYSVSLGEENQIFVKIYDQDQERVADMVNYSIFLLDSINTALNTKYSKEEKIFIEDQLNGILDSLSTLESQLLSFMEENSVLSVEDQIQSEVEFAIELKYQLSIKEMELKIMKQTKQNEPALSAKRTEIEELKKQYNELFSSNHELFIDLEKAPDVKLYVERVEREIEYFNEVLMYMGPLYEQAKISAAKYIPTFEVLDYAHRPDHKSKPKRAIIVIAAFAFALISSGVYVLLKETQE